MKQTNFYRHATYLSIILVLGFLLNYQYTKEPKEIITTKTVYIRDTTEIVVTKIERELVPYDSIIYVDVPDISEIDSASIAEAYLRLHSEHFVLNKYNEIFKDDSIAYVEIETHVQENNIKFQEMVFKNRVATEINTTTIIQKHTPRNQFFIGANTSLKSINPHISWVSNERHQISIGYDVTHKLPTISYSWRFMKWR